MNLRVWWQDHPCRLGYSLANNLTNLKYKNIKGKSGNCILENHVLGL